MGWTMFQSTRPVWAATAVSSCRRSDRWVSIHAARVGRDASVLRDDAVGLVSIHAARVGRDRHDVDENHWVSKVSIHAARVGRDPTQNKALLDAIGFNPRGPCGPRPHRTLGQVTVHKFQSTRPVWAATGRVIFFPLYDKGFNPRGPCGPRPRWFGSFADRTSFNPRGPCGPRRGRFSKHKLILAVSIHAARVGRDGSLHHRIDARGCFNPRGPCGPRHPTRPLGLVAWRGFNPRGPCGPRPLVVHQNGIPAEFQSTRPVWAATDRVSVLIASMEFQSTRPVWAATNRAIRHAIRREVSIHAARVGRDTESEPRTERSTAFQSTRPVWAATLTGSR